MAELLIKIGTKGPEATAYQDGDIIAVYRDEQILIKHAEILCKVSRWATPSANVRRSVGGLDYAFYSILFRYRFERLEKTIVRKHDQWGATFVDVGFVAQTMGKWLSRRTHMIFGDANAEQWFHTPLSFEMIRISTLWDAIEPALSVTRADFARMPLGTQDLKGKFCVALGSNPSDDEVGTLTASILGFDENMEVVIKTKRSHHVPWRTLPGMQAQDVADAENAGLPSDFRERITIPALVGDLIKVKP